MHNYGKQWLHIQMLHVMSKTAFRRGGFRLKYADHVSLAMSTLQLAPRVNL